MASTAIKQSRTTPNAPLKQEADAETAAPPAKKRRNLAKVLLLLTPLLGGIGAGTWYFLQDREALAAHQPASAKQAAAKVKPDTSRPPVFVPLESFTVNLQHDDASSQYLQVGLSLKLSDDALVDKIKLHMPEIRNRVLLLLSGKKASEIATPDGKRALSAELAREIVKPLGGVAPAQVLDSVLFTAFVIQ